MNEDFKPVIELIECDNIHAEGCKPQDEHGCFPSCPPCNPCWPDA